MAQTIIDGEYSFEYGLKILTQIDPRDINKITLERKKCFKKTVGGSIDFKVSFINGEEIMVINSFAMGFNGCTVLATAQALNHFGISKKEADKVFSCPERRIIFKIDHSPKRFRF
jgi:hypothetical protein